MADIELVIKIAEEVKQKIDENLNSCDLDIYDCVMLATKNGMPLPEGHGDLIDRNECLKLKMTDLYDKDGVTMYAVPTGNILRMKPVIEADKGETE